MCTLFDMISSPKTRTMDNIVPWGAAALTHRARGATSPLRLRISSALQAPPAGESPLPEVNPQRGDLVLHHRVEALPWTGRGRWKKREDPPGQGTPAQVTSGASTGRAWGTSNRIGEPRSDLKHCVF